MTDKSAIVLPSITMNGTGRDTLMAQCLAAVVALQAAHKAIDEACPHGRDYPNDTDRFEAAVQQHLARLTTVNRLIEEYTHIGVCCRRQ